MHLGRRTIQAKKLAEEFPADLSSSGPRQRHVSLGEAKGDDDADGIRR
jgi:hypothetical protein